MWRDVRLATSSNHRVWSRFNFQLSFAHTHHPDEVRDYLDYYWITQYKLIRQLESTFPEVQLDPAVVRETEENYGDVKSKYKGSISWTPRDLITLTKEVGMAAFIVSCYYLPMQQVHPTAKGLIGRLEHREGRIVPTERLQPGRADEVLFWAHALVLQVLETQVEHFKLDAAPYEAANDDFKRIWQREPTA